MGIESFLANCKKKPYWKASDIVANTSSFNVGHILFGKSCVFTGALSKMVRKEAMQLVIDLGGKCSDGVNRNTDYLIVGTNDYKRTKDHNNKSNKIKKAEDLIGKGQEIEIISENVFYDLVLEDN